MEARMTVGRGFLLRVPNAVKKITAPGRQVYVQTGRTKIIGGALVSCARQLIDQVPGATRKFAGARPDQRGIAVTWC